MTAALEEAKAETAYDDAHKTNVYVLLEHIGRQTINSVYGPFHSRNAAKDWGLIHVTSFTVMEIMRPRGVEEVAFLLTPAPEDTLEKRGIHRDQAQIGDYIDPTVVP